jgi:MFS family permease
MALNNPDPLEPDPMPIISEEISPTFLSRGLAFSKRTFASLQNPRFRLYYTAYVFFHTSLNMQLIARSLLIYRITDSATILGLMTLAFALPVVILSYYGGSIADRYPKRTVMQIGYFVSTVLAISVGIAIQIGYLGTSRGDSWWLLFVSSLIQGIVLALTIPSQQSIIAELVPPKQIQNAVALNSLGQNVIRMIGPAIAGLIIEFAGFEYVYFVTGGLSCLGLLLLWFLPAVKRSVGKMESTFQSLKAGISYLRRDVTIMLILGIALVVFMFGMPYFTMLPIFADDILQVGASGMGLLLAVNGGGAVLGSLIMAWHPPRNRGKILLWAICFMSLGTIAFSFSTVWQFSLALMAMMGLTMALFGATTNALLLNYTTKEYHGRIMSIFMMQNGLMSLGATLAGVIADSIGSVQWAVGGMAMVLAAASVIGLVSLKRILRLD